MSKYVRENIEDSDIFVITDAGHDWRNPVRTHMFAFDTETQTYFDGNKVDTPTLCKLIKEMSDKQKREHVSNITWSWQAYDEFNGFFMTNDFETWLLYCCLCGYDYGHCYNATFDFAQIDYEILAKGRGKWTEHMHPKTTDEIIEDLRHEEQFENCLDFELREEAKSRKQAYNKRQPYTYESVHNNMGARYAYKLWFPYRSKDRHKYCHSVELHDFMKLLTGGLKKVLEGMNVTDNEGNPLRKLAMEYQEVDPNNLTESDIDYCMIDVKGLYFAVKQFNKTIEERTDNESHIHGEIVNVMTAGGLAKRELLRSLYPQTKPRFRLSRYQKEHPLSVTQDKFLRDNHLYRGGISFVNPKYKGKLLTSKRMKRRMNRYDVNSEYPYSMASIRDLVGKPFRMSYEEWIAKPKSYRERYECALVLEEVTGEVKEGMLGFWYDPFKKSYVDTIDEKGKHLIFEREFEEMKHWYDDLEYAIDYVILWKRGDYAYRPFVNQNYELKAQAKRDKNAVLQAFAKLLLNSSYGKLSERVERIEGHYALNEETGAIHFVEDKTEIEEGSIMNVAIGSLVTSFARCYILSKIREICGQGKVADRFVYIDTDSIHAFADYANADAYALGGLKLEAECDAVKYLLPKTYVDIEKVDENGNLPIVRNKQGKLVVEGLELHSKGVSISAIEHEVGKIIEERKEVKLKDIDGLMNYGKSYVILCAMNVRGGKVLLPTEKYLARAELAPTHDDKVVLTNYAGTYIMER